MSAFALGLITGALGATFIIWVSIIIKEEQSIYKEIKKDELFTEILDENKHLKKDREYYKQFYNDYIEKK